MEIVSMSAPQRTGLALYRLFFSVLTFAAIITQLTIQISNNYSVINFFSYFTNLSNIFSAIVLLLGAFYLLQRRQPTATYELFRGAAVVCIAVVGIVFGLLLRNEDLGSLLPWVNTVLHYIMPVVMFVDWLLQPPTIRLTLARTWVWLIFPFVYLVYSLVRGAISGFYPYPFFNPAKVGGYGGVALYCLGIFVLFLILTWLVTLLGNRGKRTSPIQ